MKTTTLFLLITLLGGLVALPTLAQTIRRCNNNPGISGVNMYTTVQAAHNAAAIGDIIYVEPSGTTYGALNCSKRLTIIGNGYLLDANTNTAANKTASTIGSVTFQYGSAQSRLVGLTLDNIQAFDPNITVTRCSLGSISLNHTQVSSNPDVFTNPNNFTISGCLIRGAINYGGGPGTGYPIATGTVIANNIFGSGGGPAVIGFFGATVINNTIYSTLGGTGGGPIPAVILNITSTIVTNNIIDFRAASGSAQVVGNTGGGTGYINNTVSNNICLERNGLPANNSNVNGASATLVFQVANPWLLDAFGRVYFEQDATFQLASSSPAKGIGTGGTDAGAFGGANPYVLSGQPNVPIITGFTASGAGNSSTPLTVTISVRSNN